MRNDTIFAYNVFIVSKKSIDYDVYQGGSMVDAWTREQCHKKKYPIIHI